MFGQNLTRWFFHIYYAENEWIFAKYVQSRANKHEPMQKCIGCISHDLLPKIISKCSPPIGLKGKCITSSMMMSIVKDLHIPIRYGKVKVCVCIWSMSKLWLRQSERYCMELACPLCWPNEFDLKHRFTIMRRLLLVSSVVLLLVWMRMRNSETKTRKMRKCTYKSTHTRTHIQFSW